MSPAHFRLRRPDLIGVALALALALHMPSALAAEPVTLTPAEVEAIKLKLIAAKPNPGTTAIVSFLAPGSAQAYMGHVDRSLVLWGTYLAGFTLFKALPLPAAQPGGPSIGDVAIGTLLLGVAAASSVDAYLLAVQRRAEVDQVLGRLEDKTAPVSP